MFIYFKIMFSIIFSLYMILTYLFINYLGNVGESEENMSQSYHEIFDTQAYMQSHLTQKHKYESGNIKLGGHIGLVIALVPKV